MKNHYFIKMWWALPGAAYAASREYGLADLALQDARAMGAAGYKIQRIEWRALDPDWDPLEDFIRGDWAILGRPALPPEGAPEDLRCELIRHAYGFKRIESISIRWASPRNEAGIILSVERDYNDYALALSDAKAMRAAGWRIRAVEKDRRKSDTLYWHCPWDICRAVSAPDVPGLSIAPPPPSHRR